MGIGNSPAPLLGNSRFRVPGRPGRVPAVLTENMLIVPVITDDLILAVKKIRLRSTMRTAVKGDCQMVPPAWHPAPARNRYQPAEVEMQEVPLSSCRLS